MNTTLETQNVTLAIPKEVLREVKVIAAQRGISISSLLVQTLKDLVHQQDAYEAAMHRHLAILEQGFDLGTGGNITWSREELHEREHR
ncbi:MAG TPA: CopG family transcriptional regulator [Anaerolineae bacterium]|nr:CopG family transcriptional regulator [Anaerolineae bacterium]HQH39390.1 CopG family transcriptional regulator [Anaerolineae bacterium]